MIAKEGINIEGVAGAVSEGKGYIHFNTNNPQATTSVLKKAGIKFETHEQIEIKVQDKPGELARVLHAFADANVNINGQYITLKQTLIFAVDNVPAAQKALQKFELAHAR